jgi:tRNA (mo5U34)-methyltransferase
MTKLRADEPRKPSQEPPYPLSPAESKAFIESFPSWYQRVYLGNDVYTIAGRAHHEDVWDRFAKAFPTRLSGVSVLDVGCNAGYFALQTKLLGAERVVGVEFIDFYLKQAQMLREIWGVDIEYRKMDAHSVSALQEKFHLVVFAGIFYHLKNPLQVIEDLGNLCSDAILVETEVIPDDPRNCVMVRQGTPATLQATSKGVMKFIETKELNNDGSNWWVPDTDCVMGMLRTAGFKYFSSPLLLNESRLCLIASKQRDSILKLEAFA